MLQAFLGSIIYIFTPKFKLAYTTSQMSKMKQHTIKTYFSIVMPFSIQVNKCNMPAEQKRKCAFTIFCLFFKTLHSKLIYKNN